MREAMSVDRFAGDFRALFSAVSAGTAKYSEYRVVIKAHGGEEMSCAGYFSKPQSKGLMGLREMVEELGGRVNGPPRLEERLAREQRAAAEVVEEMKAREFYVEVEKYDRC
jgi:hypothetical protein